MDSILANRENRQSTGWNASISSMIPAHKMRRVDAVVLVTGNIALHWISYFHPLHGLNVTPWTLTAVPGLVFLLRFGWPSALPIAFAILVCDVSNRSLPIVVRLLLFSCLQRAIEPLHSNHSNLGKQPGLVWDLPLLA